MPHAVSTGATAYFSFYWKKASYYFKAVVDSARDDLLRFSFPSVMFRSDKRSYQRKPLESASRARLAIRGHTFEGTLIDISRRGFLCELHLPAGSRHSSRKEKAFTTPWMTGSGWEAKARSGT